MSSSPAREIKELIEHVASAKLPTSVGEFQIHGFVDINNQDEYAVLTRGNLEGATSVLVRLHSQCLTGDVFHSARCDCGQQLDAAMRTIANANKGIIIYLPQEGRGIGLVNKIHAYALQDKGLDTVQANLALGFPDDLRDYSTAAAILKYFGIKSVRLLTNNPSKLKGITENGVEINNRVPIIIQPNVHNEFYLATKRQKSGHML